jgi:hypothetical protein
MCPLFLFLNVYQSFCFERLYTLGWMHAHFLFHVCASVSKCVSLIQF